VGWTSVGGVDSLVGPKLASLIALGDDVPAVCRSSSTVSFPGNSFKGTEGRGGCGVGWTPPVGWTTV